MNHMFGTLPDQITIHFNTFNLQLLFEISIALLTPAKEAKPTIEAAKSQSTFYDSVQVNTYSCANPLWRSVPWLSFLSLSLSSVMEDQHFLQEELVGLLRNEAGGTEYVIVVFPKHCLWMTMFGGSRQKERKRFSAFTRSYSELACVMGWTA